MPAHKHAELMLQYAQDAAETDSPWERWEVWLITHNKWAPMTEGNMAWWSDATYRRKPKTIMCNGFEIEASVSKPKKKRQYYAPAPDHVKWFRVVLAGCLDISDRAGKIPLCKKPLYDNQNDAITHARAMAMSRGVVCNEFVIEAPLERIPNECASYYMAAPTESDMYECVRIGVHTPYRCCPRTALNRGLLHLTKEAAIAHAKAMLGIDPKGE